MSRRRAGDADVHGFLNVCKPAGFSSHDVVAVVRRTLRTRRVGHAGTLDPLAEGVLPVCVGRYTRLVDYVSNGDKGYYAEIELGARTATDDAEGEIVERLPVPALDNADLDRALSSFRGTIQQVPPIYSAIKVAGQRAYALARRGDAPTLQAREVTIRRLEVVRWQSPLLTLVVDCSKGTYIRSLARDLGESLGCGAHLKRLIRLWVGPFALADAISLDELAQAASAGTVADVLQPADSALRALPAAIVDPHRLVDMAHGRPWPAASSDDVPGMARIYDVDGRLLGLAELDRRRRLWQPRLTLVSPPTEIGAPTARAAEPLT
jgi:tRNA pseudouridine55 synthase